MDAHFGSVLTCNLHMPLSPLGHLSVAYNPWYSAGVYALGVATLFRLGDGDWKAAGQREPHKQSFVSRPCDLQVQEPHASRCFSVFCVGGLYVLPLHMLLCYHFYFPQSIVFEE